MSRARRGGDTMGGGAHAPRPAHIYIYMYTYFKEEHGASSTIKVRACTDSEAMLHRYMEEHTQRKMLMKMINSRVYTFFLYTNLRT